MNNYVFLQGFLLVIVICYCVSNSTTRGAEHGHETFSTWNLKIFKT